jgi:chloramphenicol-sensitive protein RarD
MTEHRDTPQGFLYAGGAYLMWGFLPLYMKLLSHVPAWEIVPHRILWSIPVAALILWFQGSLKGIGAALASPRMLATSALCAVIISVNWGVYVWAVTSGHALQTALGYYINPLFSVLLAAVLLGERFTKAQGFAIALAALAVGVLTWEQGGIPWVSVLLCVSWGFYAYLKRTIAVGPTQGFFLEVVILAIPALLLLVWLDRDGIRHVFNGTSSDTALLACTGFVTAIPLILYAWGAKHLRLTTIALMQYSAPTMIFLIAVFLFNEPFSTAKLVAFLLIWTALAIYTTTLIRKAA